LHFLQAPIRKPSHICQTAAARAELYVLSAPISAPFLQAPVAVAGKPHYFAELDVDRTMLALSRHCPAFWASDELGCCCQGGEWLTLEPDKVLQVWS
jgi:hypothetical protein